MAGGYAVFFLLLRFTSMDYLLSYALTVVTWTGVGFELQRRFVFKSVFKVKGIARYLTTQLGLALLIFALLWILVDWIGMNPLVAYVVAMAAGIASLFLVSRFWVFRA